MTERMPKTKPASDGKTVRKRRAPLPSLPTRHWLKIALAGPPIIWGAYRVIPCSPYLNLIVIFGFLLMVVSSIAWAYTKKTLWKITICLTSIVLVWVAGILVRQAYVDTHLSEYVEAYEHYRQHWEKIDEREQHDDNDPILIDSHTLLRSKFSPALFTPMVRPVQGSFLRTEFFMQIKSNGVFLDYGGPYHQWMPINSATKHGQTFWAIVTDPIFQGEIKGPNEMLQVKFPDGKYSIEYFVQGISGVGCTFNYRQHYSVEVPRR